MRKNSFAFVLFLLLSGCNFNSSRSNLPQDNKNAIVCCTSFENSRMEKNNYAAIKLVGEQANGEEFYRTFNKIDSALGNLVSFEVESASSKFESKNGVEQGIYAVNLNCVYEKGKANERFDLISNNDKIIRIIGFHVNIDL